MKFSKLSFVIKHKAFPFNSEAQNSKIDRSNTVDATCKILASSGKSIYVILVTNFIMFLLIISTPLGIPVVPEVYSTQTGEVLEVEHGLKSAEPVLSFS